MVRSLLLHSVMFALMTTVGYPQGADRNQRPENDYSIRGKLTYGTPTPPDQRVEVRLNRSGKQYVTSAYTDSIGNFEFRNLQPGTYYVSVELADYEEVDQQVEVYSTVGRNVVVNIFLQEKVKTVRREARGFAGEDPDIVDVSQLASLPKKALKAYERGIKERGDGKIPAAIKSFEEAAREGPAFYHAFNNLGILYLRTERYREAEKAFRKALEINPRASQPSINLGSLFVQEADARRTEGAKIYGDVLDQALDVLERTVKEHPRAAWAHYYLGAAYYKSEFFKEAEETLKKASDLEPSLSQARLMTINVFTKQQRWDDALTEIKSFLAAFPQAPERPALLDMQDKILKSRSK